MADLESILYVVTIQKGFLTTKPSYSMGRQNLTPEGASTRKQENPRGARAENKSQKVEIQRASFLYPRIWATFCLIWKCQRCVSVRNKNWSYHRCLPCVQDKKELPSFGDRCTSTSSCFPLQVLPLLEALWSILQKWFTVDKNHFFSVLGLNWILSGKQLHDILLFSKVVS